MQHVLKSQCAHVSKNNRQDVQDVPDDAVMHTRAS